MPSCRKKKGGGSSPNAPKYSDSSTIKVLYSSYILCHRNCLHQFHLHSIGKNLVICLNQLKEGWEILCSFVPRKKMTRFW